MGGNIKNDTTKIFFGEEPIDKMRIHTEFIREFNHFSLNIDEFMITKKKEQKFFDIVLNKKFNLYSSLGDSEFNSIVNHGKPTAIIVCEKNTMNKDKEFHKNMYNFAKKYDGEIKFYFSTDENITIVSLMQTFNYNSQPPYIFLIEKSNSNGKNFNKYFRNNIKLEVEEI